MKSKYMVKFLGTTGYKGIDSGWYGDCIICYDDLNKQMFVYDCGSEQHADTVINFMNLKEILKTNFILSHNDHDHFNGLPKLISAGKVDKIYTTLLLKYIDDILNKLDDDRRTRDATKERILKLYHNIADLSGNNLKDIYENIALLPNGTSLIGPDKETMIDAVVKAIKENDIQSIEGSETLVNATSLQISMPITDIDCLILLGDAAVENIKCDLSSYRYIQLPHHGKLASAEAIFENIPSDEIANHTFIVSDNTGITNGGSDNLMKSPIRLGKDIKNTKYGDQNINFISFNSVSSASKKYGVCSGLLVKR